MSAPGTISPPPTCSLEATVTSSNASQYLSLFRKYMFHREYILEHCSAGLVPVWREVLTMMKVVVYLSEQRGSIQLFLIKDINAFLLDNETMPLDKDVFFSASSASSLSSSAYYAGSTKEVSSPSPPSPSSPSSATSSPEPGRIPSVSSSSSSSAASSSAPATTGIRASRSFQTMSTSFRNSFRSRSASSPAFASDEFPAGGPPSPQVLSPATPAMVLLPSLSPTPGEEHFPTHSPSPTPSSPQQPHHRSNSSGSLISKIFKSRSFDFKSAKEPNMDTRAVEEGMEKAIAECVIDDDHQEDEMEDSKDTDSLSPLPKTSFMRRRRSVSVSGSLPEDLAGTPPSSSPLTLSPIPPAQIGQSESPVPRLRRCSSVKFSPNSGMKRSPSATSATSLSSFSPPSTKAMLLDLFSIGGKEDEPERSNSDESFSLFGLGGPKPTEKDLAKEQMIKSSYRYHMRRRAVCLFHNEDMEVNSEDPPRPSRAS